MLLNKMVQTVGLSLKKKKKSAMNAAVSNLFCLTHLGLQLFELPRHCCACHPQFDKLSREYWT